MSTDTIVSIVQTIILLGGFVVGIRQVTILTKQILITAKQIESQSIWQRKNVTFEYLKKYSTEMKECNISLQEKIGLLHHNRNSIKFEHLVDLLKDNNIRVQLYELASYFETLAIGIEENYFDENIVKRSKQNVIISTFKLIKPYIDYRRHETDCQICTHFEQLVEKWTSSSN